MASKIYTRATMLKGTPKKKKDEKARKRNTIINFRVTPEEKQRIDARIAATGMHKSNFFIESCLYQTVLVKGNVRSFHEMERVMGELAMQMDRHVELKSIDPELLESMRLVLEILDRLFGKE